MAMTAEDYRVALEQAQTIVALMFGLLVILSAYILSKPEVERMCAQHRKPESQCKDEHRP